MERSYQGEDQKKYHFLFMIYAHRVEAREKIIKLKEIDSKVLFMTARPGRCRAFIPAERYLRTWQKSNEMYIKQPPHISMIYDGMKEDNLHQAKAINVSIHSPSQITETSCEFQLRESISGSFENVIFFIDWPANLICPEPIKVQLPSLFKDII